MLRIYENMQQEEIKEEYKDRAFREEWGKWNSSEIEKNIDFSFEIIRE